MVRRILALTTEVCNRLEQQAYIGSKTLTKVRTCLPTRYRSHGHKSENKK